MVAGTLGRLGATVRNAVEVARFGGLDTGEAPSPYRVVSRRPMYRLRRYFAEQTETGDTQRPAVLLVPPLIMSSEVYDVSPATSGVRLLHGAGVDPWVVDFGAPVDARQTRFAGPVSEDMVAEALAVRADPPLPHVSLPAWAGRMGLRLLDPVKSTRSRVRFLTQLHGREALLPRERQRHVIEQSPTAGTGERRRPGFTPGFAWVSTCGRLDVKWRPNCRDPF